MVLLNWLKPALPTYGDNGDKVSIIAVTKRQRALQTGYLCAKYLGVTNPQLFAHIVAGGMSLCIQRRKGRAQRGWP